MAHGYASYQDNRGNVDYLGGVIDAVKKYLDNREKKEKTADIIAAKVNVLNEQQNISGGKTNLLSGGGNTNVAEIPLQRMLGGSSLQRSLPGASAVNPDVVGGAATPGVSRRRGITGEGYFGDSIVDIGSTNLGVERDLGGGDMFTKRLDTFSDSGGGSEEVVQAIDRLTFVTMSLVSATKEQSNQQKMIAGAQRQQTDKLARKSKAAAEESALENGQDLSSNSAYQGLLRAATGAMSGAGGSSRGGGPGMGLGGKVLAKNMLKGAARRGAGRTGGRLGAALGGKLAGGFGARMGAKLGAKGVGKIAGGALAKSLGKKIPLVGLGLGAVFAAQRAMQGDFVGAGLELASGAASTVPGIGTAGSVGIDAALMARDMGAVPFAEGGIISDATLGLVGEKGKEGVFPLEGAEGRKTFLNFGEGILDAQFKNKNKFAKIQAQGLSQYYDKQNGWEKFTDALKSIFKVDGFRWPWDRDDDDRSRRNDGATGDPNITLGSEEEARIAAALATEGGLGTAATDVLQVAANRIAAPGYGSNFTEVFAQPGAFQGVYDRGLDNYKKVKTIADAARWSGRSEAVIKQYIAAARNDELRADSKRFVGGALQFRGSPSTVRTVNSDTNPRNNIEEIGTTGIIPGSKHRGGAGDNQFLIGPNDPKISAAAEVNYEGINTETPPTPRSGQTVVLYGGTNTFDDPLKAARDMTAAIRNLKKKGINVVVVPPNGNAEQFKAVHAAIKNSAKQEGATVMEGVYGGTTGKDTLHLSPDSITKIKAAYPNATHMGDSNAARVEGHNGRDGISKVGAGTSVIKNFAEDFVPNELPPEEELHSSNITNPTDGISPVLIDPNVLNNRSQDVAMASTGSNIINYITNVSPDTGANNGERVVSDVRQGLSFHDAMPVLLNAVV